MDDFSAVAEGLKSGLGGGSRLIEGDGGMGKTTVLD